MGGHVEVGHAVGVLHILPLPGPGEGVVGQAGAGALHNVRHVHPEGLGAAVDEGEVQVAVPGLAGPVLLQADTGVLRHLLLGQSLDLPQLPDAAGHLLELQIQPVVTAVSSLFLLAFSLRQTKNPPQRYSKIFETSNKIPAVPLKLHFQRKYHSSGSNKPYALTRQSREGSTPGRKPVSSFQLRSYKRAVPSRWLAPTATSLRAFPAVLSVIVFHAIWLWSDFTISCARGQEKISLSRGVPPAAAGGTRPHPCFPATCASENTLRTRGAPAFPQESRCAPCEIPLKQEAPPLA